MKYINLDNRNDTKDFYYSAVLLIYFGQIKNTMMAAKRTTNIDLTNVFFVFIHVVFSGFGGSLWEALQKPSWPELPLRPLPPG